MSAVAFSPDGSHLATASWDQTVRLWETTTGQQTGQLTDHTRGASAVAFSPDGTQLATGGGWDGTTRLWDTASGRELAAMIALSDGWAVLLPDGSYKVAGEGTEDTLWWAINTLRFDAGDLDGHIPSIHRLPEDHVLPR
ncbi:PD40 domain-containing protein [Frankia sp. CNm7]|uniref:PD40 domain-containing protein n=1 Tax=Frankia nepalensis TaxID=1836974 RepID=A0A937R9Z3_9ACTN|nr:PD40 domain-containing protein [Frankia nepalensis]MBL7513994.1 PD40 domain-containing protein [Frankia nepalensis]MBL7523485.1 PD40 domain-containing protein [Frankia nepalensis]MBL7628161.1 PD40 domain-containing protein [Frankia nepalensis]